MAIPRPAFRSASMLNASDIASNLLGDDGPAEELPIAPARPNDELPTQAGGDFPRLPPDPYADQYDPLPSLGEELWYHGGSYLYQPEGDRLNWPSHEEAHYELLRLPEDWQKPRPVELFTEFLGADPVIVNPRLKWPGPGGYVWEPAFVGYGSYDLFGFAFEQNKQRRDGIGHQLILDLDLRLTGTERFHVQYRPLGKGGTGGSYYEFSDPDGYVNNATATPDRYWFEFELHSVLGAYVDPFAALDFHTTIGKVPLAFHNTLLMNDEVVGVIVNKNTIYAGQLSNLNIQMFYCFADVDAYANANADLVGIHAQFDHRLAFHEATYAFVQHDFDSDRDSHFLALSRTQFFGPLSLAGRALFKVGDRGGRGSGQLFVLESNYTRTFDREPYGVSHGVFYANAFAATSGWNAIAGNNFNRLTTAFEVNPLVRLSAGIGVADTYGVAAGVQLFRHHEDESLIPEIAYESPDGASVFGLGLRYLRKTGPRSFIEVQGVYNESNDSRFDREGIFTAYHIIF